jgi:hypothetical protein
MNLNSPSKKFVVPHEVYTLLDPIEQFVIRDQERRGELTIEKEKIVEGSVGSRSLETHRQTLRGESANVIISG